MRRDRAPSMASWDCATCGDPLAARMTDLAQAEHDVHHLAARKTLLHLQQRVFSHADWIEYAHALERLDVARQVERKAVVDPLNRRIVDLEIAVAGYEWDLKVVNELVDDLKADLAAAEEGRRDG